MVWKTLVSHRGRRYIVAHYSHSRIWPAAPGRAAGPPNQMPRPDRSAGPDFRERYGVLLDIGRILTGTLEPGQLYRSIYEQASRVLETTGFYISLFDAEKDRATVVFYADRGEIERPATTYRGSASRAIREGRPIVEDLSRPEEAVMLLGPESDEELTRSAIAAPMRHGGKVIGVISAQSYRPDAYDDGDLELLTAIADLAAVAVSNARTVAEMERRKRESDQLEKIGRALTASLELDQVLRRVVTAIRDLVQADGAAVWFLRPDRRAEIVMSAGDLALPIGTEVSVSPTLATRFLRDRQPLVVDRRTGSSPEVPVELLEMLHAQSAIGVPLVAESELVGALSVSHAHGRTYSSDDVRLMERFAVHAAIAVANARLHEKVRLLSLTDPLTELPNRRHMTMLLEKEFAAAERGRGLSIVLFDLDDFKLYNDTAGHQAGDEILRRFARVLERETRAMNLAARYGGDEFICILSDTDHEGGAIHAGRVMKAVRADSMLSAIGVSAGIAVYDPSMESPQDLIRRADRELYSAKAERRGQVPTG